MKFSIIPTGVNSASTLTGFHTNYLVRWNDNSLLIDAGTLIMRALHELEVPPTSITAIYASHMHPDHVGGIYDLGYRIAVYEKRRLPVYLHSEMSETIWDNYLSGVATHYRDATDTPRKGDRNTFFDFRPIQRTFEAPEPGAEIDGLTLRLVRMDHIPSSPCHGVVLDERVFVTTDTRFLPQMLERVVNQFPIEAVFHDCMFSPSAKIYHTLYEELMTLPKDIRDLLILTHYEDELPIPREKIELQLGEAGREYRF